MTTELCGVAAASGLTARRQSSGVGRCDGSEVNESAPNPETGNSCPLMTLQPVILASLCPSCRLPRHLPQASALPRRRWVFNRHRRAREGLALPLAGAGLILDSTDNVGWGSARLGDSVDGLEWVRLAGDFR